MNALNLDVLIPGFSMFHVMHENILKTYIKDPEFSSLENLYRKKFSTLENDVLKSLDNDIAKLRKSLFIDYGDMEKWTSKQAYFWNIVDLLHSKDMKAHPELHERRVLVSKDGVHANKCKCGLCSSMYIERD